MKYQTVAIGGTFDRFHKGHEYFISQAFRSGHKVIIGLTSDSYVKEKFSIFKSQFSNNFQFPMNVRNFNERKRELEEFLREEKLLDRAEIVKIDDIYGPTIERIKNQESRIKNIKRYKEIEALVVTEETEEGGEKINKKRKDLGLPLLKIIEVALVQADDKQRISSTRIRLGEIDRWGKVFEKLSIFGGKIPDNLRLKLKKPLGRLISGSEVSIADETSKLLNMNPVSIIAVGDEATAFLNKLGKMADISIVDFYIKRIRVHEKMEDLAFPDVFFDHSYSNKIIKARNPAGSITRETVSAIKMAFQEFIKDGKKRVIEIDGEEDLAGLPAILLAPLDSLVFYGQPDQGIVAVPVTEEKKKEIM